MTPIKLGMVGGGKDAFIGAVHRIAARMDGHFELVAGALSSTPEKARESADELGLLRSYDNFSDMATAEASLEEGIDAVAIVTPNHVHADAAIAFLERGIHVICDKPLTSTLEDAERLVKVAKEANALFILTHNYTGYPMIRQAREIVASGQIGEVRVVQVEYAQDWLTEAASNKQGEWRTDPLRSGAGGSTGDIGTHAFNLAQFVTGLTVESLSADLQSFVANREVDDNAHVMLRFKGGARGMLWCSQVAVGSENALKLRVYGSQGGIEWEQENPNYLYFTAFGKPRSILTRSGAGASDEANEVSRIPAGHPEGYLEAFANLYTEAAERIRTYPSKNGVLPGIDEGLNGVRFITTCVRSSANDSAWESL